jgi:NADH-quinone oxidoreductase subunit F
LDLHFQGYEATPEEQAAVDGVLGAPSSGWDGGEREIGVDGRVARGGHAARSRRDLLLPAFHAVNDRLGYVSRGALEYVCRRLTVAPADAWGVLTFYHLFATEPKPPAVLHVCEDAACRVHGAGALCARLERTLGPAGTPLAGGKATWQKSPCLGQCEQAPAAWLVEAGERPHGSIIAPFTDPTAWFDLIGKEAEESLDQRAARLRHTVPQLETEPEKLRLLRRLDAVQKPSLEGYRQSGGYRALALALERGPAWVIGELNASKLVGRGGAAFPAGRKWQAVAENPGPRYVVCNADESEPGTFKDRFLLEEDPFAVVEAMTLAGFAIGAERGFIYLRGEYSLAARRLEAAFAEARAAGLLGDGISLGGAAPFRFELELRRGGGAYICGEETAQFNSIEGKRGEPRSKPPFPVLSGLFGRPTVINNVETLANVPILLQMGGAAWAALGTEGSAGIKLFCVSGSVTRPGLFEVPFGLTLGELLEMAGGLAPGRTLQAIMLGGAAGVFVGPETLSMPLTFEAARAAKATLGSGVVMVFDDTVDLGEILLSIADFFRHESCGQCVPCRIGTERQAELLGRLKSGRLLGTREDEMALMRELGQVMRDASICGLGQAASSAVESALARFPVFSSPPEVAP